MGIPKITSRFVKNAPKKSYWQKTHNFWTLPFFWWKFQFFVNIFFQVHFFTKLCLVFRNLHKIADFLKPFKSYFEQQQKIWTLLSGLGVFSETKISISMRNLKIENSAFSTSILKFWPQSIYIFRSSRFQHWPTLLYSVQLPKRNR